MELLELKNAINGIDIYILDQILKGVYQPASKILDVGCGKGRNLKWFYQQGFKVFGTDLNAEVIAYCKELYPLQQEHFSNASLDALPYTNNSMDHILCVAVLHFATNENQFFKQLYELVRVVKPGGSILIRVASNIGIENEVEYIENGTYKFPDGTNRFLVTAELLTKLLELNQLSLIGDVKFTIVQHKRCMATLVLQKE